MTLKLIDNEDSFKEVIPNDGISFPGNREANCVLALTTKVSGAGMNKADHC
jgi:hypothetical protein